MEFEMKKLTVILIVLFSYAFIVNAQSSKKVSKNTEVINEYYVNEDAQVKFPVSSIKIIADAEDVIFLQAAVRESLTLAGKINLVDKGGDTLVVNLILQHIDPITSDNKVTKGRNGKWGEVVITVLSTDGLVAATSRGYIDEYKGDQYYKVLQDVVLNLAFEKFQFCNQ